MYCESGTIYKVFIKIIKMECKIVLTLKYCMQLILKTACSNCDVHRRYSVSIEEYMLRPQVLCRQQCRKK